jgi:hypothetical protein
LWIITLKSIDTPGVPFSIRGVVVVLRSRRVAQDAHRGLLAPAAVHAQLVVAAVAVLDLDHLPVVDRAGVADHEVGDGVAGVLLGVPVDGVVPAERETDRVRAFEQRLPGELAVLGAEGVRVVERREVGRRDRDRERVRVRVVRLLDGLREDVALLGDHPLVVEGRARDHRAAGIDLGDVPVGAVGLAEPVVHARPVARAEVAAAGAPARDRDDLDDEAG